VFVLVEKRKKKKERKIRCLFVDAKTCQDMPRLAEGAASLSPRSVYVFVNGGPSLLM